MRPKKIRAQKVMHTRKGWKHADGVKRLRIIMASVACGLLLFSLQPGRCSHMDDVTRAAARAVRTQHNRILHRLRLLYCLFMMIPLI